MGWRWGGSCDESSLEAVVACEGLIIMLEETLILKMSMRTKEISITRLQSAHSLCTMTLFTALNLLSLLESCSAASHFLSFSFWPLFLPLQSKWPLYWRSCRKPLQLIEVHRPPSAKQASYVNSRHGLVTMSIYLDNKLHHYWDHDLDFAQFSTKASKPDGHLLLQIRVLSESYCHRVKLNIHLPTCGWNGTLYQWKLKSLEQHFEQGSF